MPGIEGEKQREYIQLIQESGNRMLNIINELVNIAKIESHQTELEMGEIRVNSLLDELSRFFSHEAQKKGLELDVKKALSDENSLITTDATKLNQILSNLITNAIKYTRTGRIEYGYLADDENLRFYVSDTGIGIPEAVREKIFERFRQAEMTISRPYDGTGLGLSISKAYVEMLGGKIWLESEMGKGSIFYFTLPRTFDSAGHLAKSNETPTSRQDKFPENITVLVAEDESMSYTLIREWLEKQGIKTLRAENGRDAVEIVKNHPEIDLVLMDIKMPEMDGYEATKQIRHFNQEVVIIAQTAFALAGDREVSTEAGCDDYIAKPIRQDQLLASIEKFIKR
jgi:CheY-like chemotaxis protein/two-component sensor histidine kinase